MKKSGLNIIIISFSIIIVGLLAYFLLFLNKPSIESITINKKAMNIFIGETMEIPITILPENANRDILWESSDPTILSITEDGMAKGEKIGSTIVTVKNKNGDISDNCKVNVIKKEVSDIKFIKDEVELLVGEKTKLEIEVLPNELDKYELNWSSSEPDIVSVDEHGNITAINNGEALITVSSGNIMSSCTVKVVTIVESIVISKSRTTVDVEETDTLEVIVNPDNASNKSVVWESSDPSIATVSDGKITGVKPGSAVITVKTIDGNKTATCDVTVILIPRYTIKFTDTNQSIIKKEGQTLGELPTPKKEGYIFKGWYTDDKEGKEVTEKTVVESDMTLYGRWEEEETYTEGPGEGYYSKTVTYMGRTFRDYKQNRMGAAISAGGCGPVSLYSILSGYDNSISIDQIIKVSGLSTSFNYINAAARTFGLSHSQVYVYSSRNPNPAALANLTNIALSELKRGHQLIVLVTRSSLCPSGVCNGLPYDAYSWGNHFIAIVGVKKDGEHVIILNPQEVRMEEGRMEDILKYYLPGGSQSGFVSYWK